MHDDENGAMKGGSSGPSETVVILLCCVSSRRISLTCKNSVSSMGAMKGTCTHALVMLCSEACNALVLRNRSNSFVLCIITAYQPDVQTLFHHWTRVLKCSA